MRTGLVPIVVLLLIGILLLLWIIGGLGQQQRRAALQQNAGHAALQQRITVAPAASAQYRAQPTKRVRFSPYVRVKEVATEWQLRKAGLGYAN